MEGYLGSISVACMYNFGSETCGLWKSKWVCWHFLWMFWVQSFSPGVSRVLLWEAILWYHERELKKLDTGACLVTLIVFFLTSLFTNKSAFERLNWELKAISHHIISYHLPSSTLYASMIQVCIIFLSCLTASSLFEHTRLVGIKHIDHTAQFLDRCQCSIISYISLRLIVDYQTSSPLIQYSNDHLVENHLW